MAKNAKTGKLVNILDYEDPKSLVNKGQKYICHDCGGEVSVRSASYLRRQHFFHLTTGRNNDSVKKSCETTKRTTAHWEMMYDLYKRLKSKNPKCEILFEYTFKNPDRRADLVVIVDGFIEQVHEIQLSQISYNELVARNEDYMDKHKIDQVHWSFLKNALTPAIKDYLHFRNGYLTVIEQHEEVKKV